MLSDDEIVRVADEVLAVEFAAVGFVRSRVLAGIEQDGEPTISVVARFRPGAEAVPGKAALRAMTALHRALQARGEERESVLRYEFPDDDVPAIDLQEFDPTPR